MPNFDSITGKDILPGVPSLDVNQVTEGVMMNPQASEEPLWIVNQSFLPDYGQFVSCFSIQPESILRYQKHGNDTEYLDKKFEILEQRKQPYGEEPKTPLSKLAKAKYDKTAKTTRKKFYYKPIFSTIMLDGTDTFSGQYGMGFYEHLPKKETVRGGAPVVTMGESTGVFLSYDRVTPLKQFVPTTALVNELTDEVLMVTNELGGDVMPFDIQFKTEKTYGANWRCTHLGKTG